MTASPEPAYLDGVAPVELIGDVADQLLEDVFDGDDPCRTSVLVDDDREGALGASELSDESAQRLTLGDDQGVLHDLGDQCRFVLSWGDGQQILDMNGAQDVIFAGTSH